MSYRHRAIFVPHQGWLAVLRRRFASGRIPDVPDPNRPFESVYVVTFEDLWDQAHGLVSADGFSIIDGYAG